LINRLHFAELHPPAAAARIISSKVSQARYHYATLLEPLTQHRFVVYGLGLQSKSVFMYLDFEPDPQQHFELARLGILAISTCCGATAMFIFLQLISCVSLSSGNYLKTS
jgi:hypothetical protein